MISKINNFFRERTDYSNFKKLSRSKKKLVFYSENKNYWTFFEKIIQSLNKKNFKPIYLTSDPSDLVFTKYKYLVDPFYIGDGTIRTICFLKMEADIFAMTMPDLDNFYIKKSSTVKMYVYIHHSIVSQHLVYNEKAFDNFDVIFCVGRHHIAENLERQKKKKIICKKLVQHGYGRLDQILEDYNSFRKSKLETKETVLIAPSWGKNSIIERLNCAKLIINLLKGGYVVILRPHPRTFDKKLNKLKSLGKKLSGEKDFKLDVNYNSTESIIKSDYMVSDFSGTALEFSFAKLKPILFIDLPLKINNPNYNEYGMSPLEIKIRDKIGIIMPEERVHEISTFMDRLVNNKDIWEKKIKNLRNDTIFNVGKSGPIASKWFLKNISS